jgi:outer membrane protein insertion porin family
MLSSWKAALTSRAVIAAAIIATAALSAPWGSVSAAGSAAPAQGVGDTVGTVRPWISKVRWEGLEQLDAGAVGRGSYLRSGLQLSDSLLDLELGRIDSLCFSVGLLGALAAVDTTLRGESVEITMLISEGSQTKTGGVTVSGSEVIPEAELVGRLGVSEGAPFDPVALENAMTVLLSELNRAGYPYAQVWMTGFEYDRPSNTVDLTFAVYGGEESIVETVVFDGLTKTDTSLALQITRLKAGERFDEDKLARASRYLSASGLFSRVGQPEVRRLGPGLVDVNIPVEEAKRGNAIQGIFGFARKEDGGYITNGLVDIALRNIGGSGRDVDFRWLNDGVSFQTLQFRYSEDFLFSLPPGLDAELRQDVYDTLYDYTMVGFDMSLSTGPGSEVSAGYTWDNNIPQNDPVLDRSVRHRFRAGAKAVWPGRAHLALRVEGALRREYAGGATDTDSQLLYGVEGDTEIPVFSMQSIYMRLVSMGVFSKDAVRPAETYPLGGARSLRGYRENQFRGEKIAWANFEYRFGGASRIFLFYDAGAYYRKDTGWQYLDGLGFGLMSSSKLGTVALSFGMGESITLDGMMIHISLIENF